MVNHRDTVLIRLLCAGCRILSERGMAGAFVDGCCADDRGLEMIGKC